MLVIMLMIKTIMDLQGNFPKLPPTVIYDYTKSKSMNMQLENLIPERNIDNKDKKYDERYQINMIDVREYNKSDQISENKEGTLNTDIEVLILRKLSSQKKETILRNILMK